MRVIVTEGVTVVGARLLEDLPKLQELNLADSVHTVNDNNLRSLRILRAGAGFRTYRGCSGALTELRLPDHPV